MARTLLRTSSTVVDSLRRYSCLSTRWGVIKLVKILTDVAGNFQRSFLERRFPDLNGLVNGTSPVR